LDSSVHQGGDLVGGLLARDDAVGEVGPVEDADEDLGLAQAELVGDVLADLRGGGRGEGLHADGGGDLAQLAQAAVLGAEVVAPLADAVGLVDDEGAEQVGVGSASRRAT
jgi:hypothetical protein